MTKISFVLVWLVISSCVQPVENESSSAGNRPPKIRSVTASPQEIHPGIWTTITADVIDEDGDPLKYSWSATAGDIIGEGKSIRYTAVYCCVGSNAVTVEAKDNRGGKSSSTIDIFVRQ